MAKYEWIEVVLLGLISIGIGVGLVYTFILFLGYLYSIGH